MKTKSLSRFGKREWIVYFMIWGGLILWTPMNVAVYGPSGLLLPIAIAAALIETGIWAKK